MMKPIVVVFEYSKPTMSRFQYEEVQSMRAGEQPVGEVIGTLHIRKFVLGDRPPERLTVTIAATKE